MPTHKPELELIQSHMAQKPVLRVEVYDTTSSPNISTHRTHPASLLSTDQHKRTRWHTTTTNLRLLAPRSRLLSPRLLELAQVVSQSKLTPTAEPSLRLGMAKGRKKVGGHFAKQSPVL